MLQLLNTGLTLKVSELAEQLETTPRNIIEYKKELETAGFYIISMPGRYGGYKLVKETLCPTVKLTEKEKVIGKSGNLVTIQTPLTDDFYLVQRMMSFCPDLYYISDERIKKLVKDNLKILKDIYEPEFEQCNN